MPIAEAYQQAILNGVMQNLLTASGGSFKVALFKNNLELSGNGYSQKSISTVPSASAVGVNGLSTVKLTTDTTLTASGGDISFDSIKILDSTGTNQVLPTFTVTGTISSGESRKVTAVFGLPDNSSVADRVTELETSVSTLETDVTNLEPITDASLIQPALDDNLRPVVIGEGDYTISTGLDVIGISGSTKVGRKIYGAGYGENYAVNHPNRGVITQVIYNGARDAEQSVVRIKSSFVTLEDLVLSGQSTGLRVPIGIDLRQANGGAGKVEANRIFLYYCQKAIRLAKDSNEGNCDESVWNKLFIYLCDVGIEINSAQTLSHVFNDLNVFSVPTVFSINGGGNLESNGGTIESTTTWFKFNNTTPNEFGSNGSKVIANNLKIDAQAVNTKLVDFDSNTGYYSEVELTCPQFPLAQWTGPMFNLSGKTKTTVRGLNNFQYGRLSWNSPDNNTVPIFNIEDVTVYPYTGHSNNLSSAEGLFPTAGNTRKCYVIAKNVWQWQGSPLRLTKLSDFEGELTGT